VSEGPAGVPRVPVRTRRPLADDVSDLIAREFVLSGVVAPGELLPSEKELADRYGVSRVTIRASIRTLREAGLISVRHGVGSVVLPRSSVLMYGLDRLCSFETFAIEAGGTVTTEDVEFARVPAGPEEAEKLQVAEGAPTLHVRRAKVYGPDRIAFSIDVVPEGVLAFERIEREFAGSVLDLLMAEEALGVDYADLEIEPVTFEGEIAERLAVAPGTIGLYMDEVVHDVHGRVVDWGRGWHVPQNRRFFLRRRRQVGS
jgi:GntR family transcriptional regulator